jgi:hypothetical protein
MPTERVSAAAPRREGAKDGDVTMIEHLGRTRRNLLTRCLAIAAMLTFYGLGTLGMSALALTSTTKLAEAQIMRGWGRGHGYPMIAHRGGHRGRGFFQGLTFARDRNVVGSNARTRRAAIPSPGPMQTPSGFPSRGPIRQPDFGASVQRTSGPGPIMIDRGGSWSGGGGSGSSRLQDSASESGAAGTSRPAAKTASAARDERIFLCARMSDKDRAATPCCKPPYEVACR